MPFAEQEDLEIIMKHVILCILHLEEMMLKNGQDGDFIQEPYFAWLQELFYFSFSLYHWHFLASK